MIFVNFSNKIMIRQTHIIALSLKSSLTCQVCNQRQILHRVLIPDPYFNPQNVSRVGALFTLTDQVSVVRF